jgi:2-polyprenyl-6-hydroxyphenyl methylase / 3-demethylubiquinone-9 3-methyltransferase
MPSKKHTLTPNTAQNAGYSKHFGDFADNWWHSQGPMRALHQLNPVRVGWLMAQLPAPLLAESPLKILDVGCGGGLLAESLTRLGHNVTGIDPSTQLINVAQNHAQSMGLNINYEAALLQQHQTNNYQLITLSEVLEHVDNVAEILEQAATRLSTKGYVFISTINRTPQSWLGAIALAEHIWRLVPRATNGHNLFNLPSLSIWPNKQGLT